MPIFTVPTAYRVLCHLFGRTEVVNTGKGLLFQRHFVCQVYVSVSITERHMCVHRPYQSSASRPLRHLPRLWDSGLGNHPYQPSCLVSGDMDMPYGKRKSNHIAES